ncbi:hypothetical protein GGU11DRAFT_761312 [Lentinula aff. detonsa]|nr:hypothetical protein GGU11DRAFT_761312 [Lentinula aff. detonsa]
MSISQSYRAPLLGHHRGCSSQLPNSSGDHTQQGQNQGVRTWIRTAERQDVRTLAGGDLNLPVGSVFDDSQSRRADGMVGKGSPEPPSLHTQGRDGATPATNIEHAGGVQEQRRSPPRMSSNSTHPGSISTGRNAPQMGIRPDRDHEITPNVRAPENREGSRLDAANLNNTQQRQMNRRQRRVLQKGRATKKAAVQVGSLNMLTHPDNKWKSVWYLMKRRKIGILALQETHLTDKRVQEINEYYNKKLHVFASHNPDNPTGKGGVAIVINRRQIALEAPKVHPIIPGHAMMVQLTIHKEDQLNILVVYAPNVTSRNGSENADFWNGIETYFEERRTLAKPDILLGDCNMVEAGIIDWLPAHDDPEDACEALDNLKMRLNIWDGWRTTFPDTKSFTYMQSATGVQSRIDQIYMSDRITESGIPNADHSLISVQITSEEAPWIGKGRWRIPDYVIKDKDLLKYAHQKGIEAEQKLTELTAQSSTLNAQLIWETFKKQLVNKAKDRAKQIVPGLTRKINEHQLELERVLNDQEMLEQAKMTKSKEIKTEITHLEKMCIHKTQRDSQTHHVIEQGNWLSFD